jgi:hypothetical protein
VWEVEYTPEASRQRATLAPAGRRALDEAVEGLRADPWRGWRYHEHPKEFRVAAFGDSGLFVYIVAERRRTFIVLDITWAG